MKNPKINLGPRPGLLPGLATGLPSKGLPQLKQTEAELVAAVFGEALKLHQMGRLAEAEQIYRQILSSRPNHFDALHLSGVVAYQRGDHAEAVRRIDEALKRNPSHAGAWNNRGIALSAQNMPAEALESFSRAVKAQRDFVEAHSNRSNVLRQLGRFEEAVANCDRAIKLRPDYAEAHSNRGLALHHLQRFTEAIESCDRAIALRPDFADAHCNRGLALKGLKHFEDALASLDQAIALRPDLVEAHSNRASVLRDLDRNGDALASCDRAIALRPDFAEAHSNRCSVLLNMKRYEEALASCDRALELRPDLAEAYCNRGNVLMYFGRFEDALDSYDRAAELQPSLAEAFGNRSNALRKLGRFEEALATSDRAIALRPDYADPYSNRGVALEELGRLEEALESYERAVAIKPDFADAHLNAAMCRLRFGNYDAGWKDYEWRWSSSLLREGARGFSQPLWLGDGDIAGKTVLLHAEQGLGDTLHFSRFVPPVAERGGRVILEVQGALRELMESLKGDVEVIAQGDPLPDFDLHCPLLSLPLAFRTTLDTIPREPYLTAAPGKVAAWRDRLGERERPRVGVVWAGNAGKLLPTLNMAARHLDFETLAPLYDVAEYQFFSLQKGDDAAKKVRESDFRDRIIDLTDELNDFSDTAALIANLDLVISVDTSVAHLAGALGKPVWLMNRHNACWRWLCDRDDSPWYPSLRQFRQDAARDWDAVIRRIADALRDRVRDAEATGERRVAAQPR
jgi:tetratricopeptide (TPR) repeat protein